MELRLGLPFFSSRYSTSVRSLFRIASQRLAFRLLGPLSPAAASRRAHTLFLTPPRHPHSDEELALLGEAESLTLPFPTRSIAMWRWGDPGAPAVLLVHGWGGRGGQMRAFVRPLLKAGFSVIAFDAPGHGMSGGGEVTFVHFSYAVEAIARRLGPLAGVVAHSFGGPVVSDVLSMGAPIGRVVLIAPPASMVDASRRFARLLHIPERVRSLMQKRIETEYGIHWQDFEIEQVAWRLATPALIIHDVEDAEVPIGNGERYAASWPGARFLATRGFGHRRILRNGAVVAEAVAFLCEPGPAGASAPAVALAEGQRV